MVLLAPRLMGVSTLDAAVMGAVVGAVSPAVLVPRMLRLLEEGYGAEKGIPQMILAGASVDDVFVIVLFSSFTGMAQGGSPRASALLGAPVSILLTAPLGALAIDHTCRRLLRREGTEYKTVRPAVRRGARFYSASQHRP